MRYFLISFFIFINIQTISLADTIAVLPDSITTQLKNLSSKAQIDYLAKACWDNRLENPQLAIQESSIAIALAKENDLPQRIAELNNYIGSIYLNYQHNIALAAPYFHKARDISMLSNDSIQLAYAYNNLGDLYFATNNIPLTIQYSLKSKEIFDLLNHTKGIAYSITNLGDAFNALNDYTSALNYFNTLLEIETKAKNLPGIAVAQLKIGETYINFKRYEEALVCFNTVLNLPFEFNKKIVKANCLAKIATIYIEQNKYTKASSLIKKAIELNTKSNYTPGLIKNKLAIARLLSLTDQQQLGEKILNQAIDLSYKLNFNSYLLLSYHTQAQFYANLNKPKLTIESYEKYLSVYDSLFSLQSFETLNEIQKSHEINSNINQIENDLESSNNEKAYLIIIIGLLVIIVAFVFLRIKTISRFNKELIETNDTKDKLFSIIAHDLKSPFNTLLGFSELINENVKNKEYDNIEQFSAQLYKTSNETYNLISNLLYWSRSQQKNLKLNKELFNIADLIHKIISLNQSQAFAKGIKFDDNGLNNIQINTDRNFMYIVISNLITNAIKFTPQNGQISFRTETISSRVEISITDTGIGMSNETLKNLFNIKESKSTPGTNDEQGTGLGLIICKEFIEKDKGILSVKSEIGKGSTFKIILPQPMS